MQRFGTIRFKKSVDCRNCISLIDLNFIWKRDKNYSSEEEEAKKEKNLVKLIRMFPHVSSEHIRKLFKSNRYDAKSCIDILLKEKENINDDVNGSRRRRGSSSPDIDEWSDGNEDIRQRNRLNRERKRRLSDDKLSGDSARPKSRKVIVVESDDDEEHDESKTTVKKVPSAHGSSSSNSPKNDSLSSDKSSTGKKPAKKKTVLHSSSDEATTKRAHSSDDDDRKSSKKKKDKKKKKKKKRRAVGSDDDQGNYDDGGDDFNRNDNSDDSGDTSGSDEFNYSDFMKTAILNTLNKSTFDDIQSMINISAKKLEKLISLRPFKSFPQMVGLFL